MLNDMDSTIFASYGNEILNEYNEYIKKLYVNFSTNQHDFSFNSIESYIALSVNNIKNIIFNATRYFIKNIVDTSLVDYTKKIFLSKNIKLIVKEKKVKSILTIIGKFTYSRTVLTPKTLEDRNNLSKIINLKTIIPFDLFFKTFFYSNKISETFMLEIAHLAITINSYEKARYIISRMYNIKISHESIRCITNVVGKVVYNYETKISKRIIAKKENFLKLKPRKKGYGILEMDGSFIFKEEYGEKIIRSWGEVKIALLSSSDELVEYKNSEGKVEYKIGKRNYTCFFGCYEDFKKYVLAEYVKNKYFLYENLIILGGGAKWIRSFKEEFFPNSIQILDFFHVAEHAYEYAKFVFKNESEAKQNFHKWCKMLKNSEIEELLNILNKYSSIEHPKDITNFREYLISNKDCIDYKKYIANGYFIGSGAIESANKYVTQSRLKHPGMCWKKENAQYLLTLKSKDCSDSWVKVEKIFLNCVNLKFKNLNFFIHITSIQI